MWESQESHFSEPNRVVVRCCLLVVGAATNRKTPRQESASHRGILITPCHLDRLSHVINAILNSIAGFVRTGAAGELNRKDSRALKVQQVWKTEMGTL